jgi:hypothetical protein
MPQSGAPLEAPVGAASPFGIDTGAASQKLRLQGESQTRADDAPKAAAEKVLQDQAAPLHPEKPLTPNQLRILHASLTKAIADNQIPGTKAGFIAGGGLEKWADGVLHDNSWMKQANGDPLGLKLTAVSAKRVAALIVKGAAVLERGITSFADWSREMIKEHGQEIKPWLRHVYNESARVRSGAFSKGGESNATNPQAVKESVPVESQGTSKSGPSKEAGRRKARGGKAGYGGSD